MKLNHKLKIPKLARDAFEIGKELLYSRTYTSIQQAVHLNT